ncbi:MAG: sigma-54-dependent Fis family transcriptional regulator, partial [Myxococcales bacterium]|nr:sigma-54-dependent Fis family transcriptional regulator [Myxococcales bacterium]
RVSLRKQLESLRDLVHVVGTESALLRHMAGSSADVVLADVELARQDPTSLVTEIKRRYPSSEVIFLASRGSVEDAVRALKAGASDYLVKPIDPALLSSTLRRSRERVQLERQLVRARQAVTERVLGPAMIGESTAMQRLNQRVSRCARTDASVLILGESGTGKELVARMLHATGPRANRPFVAVNCAAFPDALLEAELFGHERGAFTGAVRQRRGRFQLAHGGTLFLDEVAEMSIAAQAKLLRVLQDGTLEPLGSDRTMQVDVRIISATHRDLKEQVARGAFRADVLFRLKVLELRVPPLRERAGDLPALIEHFLSRFSFQATVPTITTRAWAALQNYSFPGNVRELEHAIQHAVVLCDSDEIDTCHLPDEFGGDDSDSDSDDTDLAFMALGVAHRQWEREYLMRALHTAGGQRSSAAQLLGISRKNLWEKLKGHGLADHLRGG